MRKLIFCLLLIVLVQSICYANVTKTKDAFDNRIIIQSNYFLVDQPNQPDQIDKILTKYNPYILFSKNFLEGKELPILISIQYPYPNYRTIDYSPQELKIDDKVYPIKVESKFIETQQVFSSFLVKGAFVLTSEIQDALKTANAVTLRVHFIKASDGYEVFNIPLKYIEEWKQVLDAPIDASVDAPVDEIKPFYDMNQNQNQGYRQRFLNDNAAKIYKRNS